MFAFLPTGFAAVLHCCSTCQMFQCTRWERDCLSFASTFAEFFWLTQTRCKQRKFWSVVWVEVKHVLLKIIFFTGLDVVNASILYFALQVQGQHVDLGSVRPAPITTIETPNIKPFHAAGTIITASTEIKKKGRYIEPRLAQLLNTQVLFFSRNMEARQEESQLRPQQVQLLRDAITLAKETYKYDYMLFVDGGGDSLCLTSNDMNQGSQFVDPFLGGDAELLEATYTVPGTVIQAVISVGLDIDKQAFANHVKALAAMGGYLGRMNMKTGEQQDWKCPFQCNNTYLKSYFELADQVLILNEKHFNDTNRLPSTLLP